MIKSKLARISLISIFSGLLVLIGFVGSSIGQSGVEKVELEEKKIGKDPSPVKIIEFGVGKDQDWLKGLTIEVENVSTKPIYYFRYAGFTGKETGQTIGAYIPMLFNREMEKAAEQENKLLENLGSLPLNPRERVKIVIDQQRYQWLKEMEAKGTISPIKKIHFVLQVVYYGDGTRWMTGNEQDYTKLGSPN